MSTLPSFPPSLVLGPFIPYFSSFLLLLFPKLISVQHESPVPEAADTEKKLIQRLVLQIITRRRPALHCWANNNTNPFFLSDAGLLCKQQPPPTSKKYVSDQSAGKSSPSGMFRDVFSAAPFLLIALATERKQKKK